MEIIQKKKKTVSYTFKKKLFQNGISRRSEIRLNKQPGTVKLKMSRSF